jgi:hypothetical protein
MADFYDEDSRMAGARTHLSRNSTLSHAIEAAIRQSPIFQEKFIRRASNGHSLASEARVQQSKWVRVAIL